MPDLLPDAIRAEVLKRITPTQDEIRLQKDVIEQLTAALIERQEASTYPYSFIEPQGSTGLKQTQLQGAADIDLFVGLKPEEFQDILRKPTTERHREIDRLMNTMVEDWFVPSVAHLEVGRIQKAFSQHPFLSLHMRGMEVDILGCFDISADTLAREGPITAVDRTVHHSRFVAGHLDSRKREDARILKSFVRACHAYGDTCAVGRMGLTGVALELVVIATRGLDEALRRLEELDVNPLDPCNRTVEELKKVPAFRDNHIFLIDPTDPGRNVASSFTPRSYRWVQYEATRLRKALDRDNKKEIMCDLIESEIPSERPPRWLQSHCISLEFEAEGQTHYTILRDKIYRLMKKLQNELLSERTGESRFGESLAELLFRDNRYAIGLIVERPRISTTFLRQGPPTHLEDAVKEFKSTHDKVKTIDGFLFVEEKRKWTKARDLVKRFIQENAVEDLSLTTDTSQLSIQVINVLSQFILCIEPGFAKRITRVKDVG